eukprot:TRINITY_DN4508_c0_g1_i1.p1 TRINITY_DN4508_c0_g1~~TRINITY_DN4508_c0_g1_i1.p1  ORF type:complete len:111 (+),score=27.79 TRINITY_DN4508_c0_g1_i1:178-510(+)
MVYKHGSTLCIPEEGMNESYDRGNLYIEFEVDFKKSIDFNALQIQALKKILPKPQKINVDRNSDNVDEVTLIEVDIEEEKRKFQEHKEKNQYDEDDEEDQRPRQTQCRAQ